MNTGKTLFAQIMDFLPWSTFDRIVARYDGNRGVRKLSCAAQYQIMAFAQLRRWCTLPVQGELIPITSGYMMIGWRRTESGRPAANIRFSTATPIPASVCWAAKPRARNRGPISVL